MKLVQMTAVGGPEVLELVDVPEPEPEYGEVRVKNEAIAINFHEINERRGQGETPDLPVAVGSDFAGYVDKLGEGVTHLAEGDRVVGIAARGAYAEKTCTMSMLAIPLPDGVSFEQAAACPVAGLTAHFLLSDNHVDADSTIVMHAGAGSVGCFVGGLVRQIGCTSIALVSTAEKAEVAKTAGHTHVVNYREQNAVDAVRELTNGEGADVVYDSVAGENFLRSFDMAGIGGTVVLFGHAAGDPPADQFSAWMAGNRNQGLRQFFLGTVIANRMMELMPAYQRLFDAFVAGQLYLPITTLPLTEAREGHRRIEAQETFGKVILRP